MAENPERHGCCERLKEALPVAFALLAFLVPLASMTGVLWLCLATEEHRQSTGAVGLDLFVCMLMPLVMASVVFSIIANVLTVPLVRSGRIHRRFWPLCLVGLVMTFAT